jgi:predicted CoA-binding protein
MERGGAKMKVAVLGASPNPDRYSHQAVRMLKEAGHEVYPVHPVVFKTLRDIPEPVHTITVYVAPERSAALGEEILGLGAKRVIFNPGAENPELAARLEAAGTRVKNACTLVMLRTSRFDVEAGKG